MFLSALTIFLFVGFGTSSSDKILCGEFKGKFHDPTVILNGAVWTLVGSISKYDKNMTISGSVPKDKPLTIIGQRFNGSEKEDIQLDFIDKTAYIVYQNKKTDTASLAKILFYNYERPRYFCFILCGGYHQNTVDDCRCYREESVEFSKVENQVKESRVDFGNQILFDSTKL